MEDAKPLPNDLTVLFEAFKESRIKYPQIKRKAEDELFSAIIRKIAVLESSRPVMPVQMMTEDALTKAALDSLLVRIAALEQAEKRYINAEQSTVLAQIGERMDAVEAEMQRRRGGRPPAAGKEAA